MSYKLQRNDQAQVATNYNINNDMANNYKKRRRLEIKRRQGLLEYRKERLERELKSIKLALLALEDQVNIN